MTLSPPPKKVRLQVTPNLRRSVAVRRASASQNSSVEPRE